MPALNQFLMKERKRRMIERVKSIKEQRILNTGVSHELSVLAKEIEGHFQRTIEKIEKAHVGH
jgi:hypothetical protein